MSVWRHRVWTSILFLTSLFKSFWLTIMWGSVDWLLGACWYNCRLSEKKGKSSPAKCSVTGDTCRHEVLSLVWERRKTNHASEVHCGILLAFERESVFSTAFIVLLPCSGVCTAVSRTSRRIKEKMIYVSVIICLTKIQKYKSWQRQYAQLYTLCNSGIKISKLWLRLEDTDMNFRKRCFFR